MRMYYQSNEEERLAFAKEAAAHFSKYPEHWTYTRDEIAQGEWFAMRFGMSSDCVVVFKIDERTEVVNYCQFIEKDKAK